MTKWYTIPARFTEDEKRILDEFKKTYDMNHNQIIRGSFEFLSRLMVSAEIIVRDDNETANKIREIAKKHANLTEEEIKELLKTIPIEQQTKDWEKYSGTISNIYETFDDIFVKNRKVGRKPLERKRGRPKERGIKS